MHSCMRVSVHVFNSKINDSAFRLIRGNYTCVSWGRSFHRLRPISRGQNLSEVKLFLG